MKHPYNEEILIEAFIRISHDDTFIVTEASIRISEPSDEREYSRDEDRKWIDFKKKHRVNPTDCNKWYDLYLRLCGADIKL